MTAISVLLGLVAVAGAGLVLAFRRPIAAAWREPVLRFPVLVFESDDWGPGPPADAVILSRIAQLLGEFRDRSGRAPVMTIGAVLAVADTPAIARSAAALYRPVTLRDARLAHIRDALLSGAGEGVFALQLHGMEHYWPAALMRAAAQSKDVAAWVAGPLLPRTEALPSHLQSRWVDASTLPSVNHANEEVVAQAALEVDEFERTFERRPAVVVPPTFVWTDKVAQAWANAGIRYLVCPGRQFVGRDAGGRLIAGRAPIVNGERDRAGLGYVVRDAYFEPERGHTAEGALEALRRRTLAGRPTLLETHRSNFVGDPALRERALGEMRRLLCAALDGCPELRFAATEEIARALVERDPRWVHTALAARLAVMLVRLSETPRLGRLLRWTGLGLLGTAWSRRVVDPGGGADITAVTGVRRANDGGAGV